MIGGMAGYLLPFEIISVHLLVVLIGAAMTFVAVRGYAVVAKVNLVKKLIGMIILSPGARAGDGAQFDTSVRQAHQNFRGSADESAFSEIEIKHVRRWVNASEVSVEGKVLSGYFSLEPL